MVFSNWRLALVTLFQAIFGWGTTCDMVILNPLVNWVKDLANQSISAHYGIHVTESQLEWVWSSCTGTYMIGGIVSSLTIKYPAEYFGRKKTVMILKNFITLVALALHVAARPLNSIELLIAARFASGAGYTYASMTTVFVSECSPVHCRGIVSTATVAIGNSINQMVGIFAGLLANEQNWHYVFLIQLPFIVIHLAGVPFIPESIKHLHITQNDRKRSQHAATFYHGHRMNTKVLEANMNAEADIAPTNRLANLRSTLAAPQLRWPLVLCCVLSLSQPGSCYIVSQYYSASTLVEVGVPQNLATLYALLLIQVPAFLCALLAVFLVERVGRRCLLLTGYGLLLGGGICWMLSSPLSAVSDSARIACEVIGMALSLAGGRVGPCILAYMLPGELAPQNSRSLTFGLASATSWAAALLVAFCFPPLYVALGSYSLAPLVFFTALSTLFIAKYMPETKGKTVREIVQPWMPVRKDACVNNARETKF